MKKWVNYLFYSLLIILILSGCHSTHANTNEDIFQWNDSFVGDNSAIINIAHQLQAAEYLNDIELKTKSEPYGIILNYDGIDSEQEYKEAIIYNATFLFAFIQNVDWITFHSGIDTYTITKKNFLESYGEDWSNMQDEDELQELIYEYLEENNVNQLLN